MTTINTSRRLPSRVIDADIDSLNGLGIVNDYVPVRDEASPPELKKARELMQTRQKEEGRNSSVSPWLNRPESIRSMAERSCSSPW
jgi:hypothetical protein